MTRMQWQFGCLEVTASAAGAWTDCLWTQLGDASERVLPVGWASSEEVRAARDDRMAALGRAGWELVDFVHGFEHTAIWFKRPVEVVDLNAADLEVESAAS